MENFKIEYFTDPLCCWSWAFEPQFRKLRFLLKDRLEITYVMGGLLRDWKTFDDPMNDVSRSAQMGPLWMQARNISGQPIDDNIWIKNPMDTSYLACMAVKAAGLQSQIAEEAMLRRLRESVMMNSMNIGDLEIIMSIADDLEKNKLLKKGKFKADLFSDKVSELFKRDLDRTKAGGISRFPTLLLFSEGRSYQITGYRPFNELIKTFSLIDDSLPLKRKIDKSVYKNSWENLTERELAEVTDVPQELSYS